MKKSIVILILLSPFIAFSQVANRDQWGNIVFGSYVVPGICEYLSTWWRASDSTWWSGGNDLSLRGNGGAAAPQAVPTKVNVPGITFQQVSNGLHDDCAVSGPADGNRGYIIGANNYGQWGTGNTTSNSTYHLIATDSAGNAFTNLKMIAGGWYAVLGGQFYLALKNDGTLWGWGRMDNGGAGNASAGTALRKPSQILLAGGKTGQFVQCAEQCAILCTDSTVQTFQNDNGTPSNIGRSFTGTGNRVPTDIGLSHIVGISIGYAVSYAWDANGDIWAWGVYCKFYGGQNHTSDNGTVTTPLKITSILNLPAPIRKIVCNHNATMALLTNGTAWGWGGVPTGAPGVGQDFDWANYTGTSGTTPYNGSTPDPWNWHVEYAIPGGVMSYYVVATPQQVAPGKSNFANIWGSTMWGFNFALVDSNNTLVMTGRNKGAVIPNGTYPADTLTSNIQGSYHVSWDVIYPTVVNPFNVPVFQEVTSPYCVLNPATFPCSNYTIPTRTHPHASVTSFATAPGQVVLNGTASTAFYFNYRLWTQLTGPATAQMAIQTSPTDTIQLTTPGTYTFKYKITDDVWQTDSAISTIVVSSAVQTGFYFAASGGGTACTIGSPCAPSRFNTVYASATAGDTLYLNRGDVFPIEIIANSSGATGVPIVVTWYGSGPEPIVGGLTTVTGFSNVSGNLWQKAYTGVYPNFITGGNTLWNIARTPNKSTGYFIPTAMGTNTITDAANVSNVSIGDSIWGRVSAFTLDKRVVSNVAGSTITVTPNWTYNGAGGLGWFKFNTTPDTLKEFRMNSGNLQVYSTSIPTVFTPTVDTCLLSEGTNQVWDHIHFQGGNNAAIILAFQATSNLSFTNDTIDFSYDAFQFRSEGAVTVSNTYIAHMTDNGVLKQNNNNYNNTFKNVTLYDIGVQPGMGGSGNASQFYSGIIAGDSGSVVVNCTIDSVGYIGTANYGSGFAIDSNLFIDWCQQLEDGGAIYTWMNAPATFARQRKILNNICIVGGSTLSHNGVNLDFSSAANGIYLDAYTQQVTVQYNAVVSVNSCAYYDHGPTNNFLNNIALNAGYAQLYASEKAGSAVISGLVIKNNQFGYNYANGAYGIRISTANNDLATFGTIDSNYYLAPFSVSNGLFTSSSVDAGTNRTIASWRSNTGYDTHSSYLNVPYLSVYYTQSAGSVPITGFNKDVFGSYYTTGSITLGSYVPALLQRISLPNLGPVSTGGQIQFR